MLHVGSKGSISCAERARGNSATSGMEDMLLESIRKSVVHKKTTIKEIVLSCASTTYEIYNDEMKRLSKEILDLRRWLREAQQQNKEMSHDVTKKVKEVERKERIILEKNEKIRKVSQEVESTRLEIKRVKSNTINKQKGKVWISKNV